MEKKIYFNEKGTRLYKGDCLKVLKTFPENTFDMVFADPPYFLSNGSFTCQNGEMVSVKKGNWDLGKTLQENFEFHMAWLKECKRVLKPNGTLWVSGTYHSIYQCGYALQLLGYHILNDIAWLKPNASPNLSCRFFTASHETIIWARKDKKAKHTFNYKAMKDWQDNYKKEIRCSHCGKSDRYEILHEKGNQMRSVWAINTPKKEEKTFGKHPTQKSLDLLRRIVVASTNEGDLVLDPFAGSCTTGVACKMYGRRFVGIDVEKEYLEVGKRRVKNINKK
ncbi:MAG: site-specific DNA-methyltransferase [Rickettsiales bacterium]|nr:site-specific DNA-methyltransferase [Rickettsiales bacterium]